MRIAFTASFKCVKIASSLLCSVKLSQDVLCGCEIYMHAVPLHTGGWSTTLSSHLLSCALMLCVYALLSVLCHAVLCHAVPVCLQGMILDPSILMCHAVLCQLVCGQRC